MKRTFVIAEVGVNHNAKLEVALELVNTAISAGADAIKFQAAIPELVATRYAQKADYQKLSSSTEESQLEMIRKVHLPLEAFPILKAACKAKGILYFATAFDMTSLAFLQNLGQDLHKVPSGEITNLPYLRAIGSCGGPLIVSTGMASIQEIGAALEALEFAGVPRSQITLLHCNTEYPTPMRDVNLLAMASLRAAFGVAVGYSDHTAGIEVPVAAVALGATVIEKHLTLDSSLPGPDHKASLEPDEFAAMVRAIRNVEEALGDGNKRPSPSESKNRPIVRKSLVAATPIRHGERFTPENLTAKRPGTGVSPMRWDEVVGRTATRDYSADDLIDL